MHRFSRKGVGWCMFNRQPKMMTSEVKSELLCRQKCVELRPHCEGYAFEESTRDCEIYKREEPQEPIRAVDGVEGVVCYQQDDSAFDTSANMLHSKITITKPDGTMSGVTRMIFCKDKAHRTEALDDARPNLASSLPTHGTPPLLTSWRGIWSAATSAWQRFSEL